MVGFLIGEEGPLAGFTVDFKDGKEWILGRDPEFATLVLEDPMVSRKHARVRSTPEGYELENFSTVNPVTQNGKIVSDPIYLVEGDILQIGSTYFRFTQHAPDSDEEIGALPASEPSVASELKGLNLGLTTEGRYLIKVVSGPNAGAESPLLKGETYILGKDPNICDILFQDLSVSRQHARISVNDQEQVTIEDLNSRNGVMVNGQLVDGFQTLSSQDLVAIGTTAFLLIDRESAHETIVSPPSYFETKDEEPEVEEVPAEPKNWKDLVISTKHLIIAGGLALVVIAGVAGMFSLFKSEPVIVAEKNEAELIKEKMAPYRQSVQFSFNVGSGKLFLTGHVLTSVEHDEMLYLLNTLPFIQSIEDNVVVDALVWQNMNALLSANSKWEGVSIHSPKPGRFVINGYLETLEDGEELTDYINLHFPYLDRLTNLVVIENNLKLQIAQMLQENNLTNVQYDIKNGELVLAGRVDEEHEDALKDFLSSVKKLQGVRRVDNFIVMTKADTSYVNITQKYPVTGYSKRDEQDYYVVINGKILGKGDLLDGMQVLAVEKMRVILEKDGIKFQINYNQP